MENLKSVLVMVTALGIMTTVGAQDVEFITTSHDFGEVKELEGAVNYSFLFINTSEELVTVSAVEASCGCTTPDWTREEVMPGDTGFVMAQYNPLNRPGKFNKSLSVSYTVGASHKTLNLYITGEVQPKPTTIEDGLATEMGKIRVKYKSLNMGKITDKESVKQTFMVFNSSDSVVSWLPEKSDLPDYFQVSFNPVDMKPKSLGEVILTYDVKAKDDLGFVSDKIVLYTSELESSEKEFNVIATIKEYFPPMSEEELQKAPRLSFDKGQHDFGSVQEGNTVVGEFVLRNSGESDLEIRKTKTNCACTVAKLSKKVVAPGESIALEVRFDTSERKGRQYKSITVFSNDPTAPTQMLSIKATVRK